VKVRLFVVAVVCWLVGVVSGLGYVAVSGGWYEYHFYVSGDIKSVQALQQLINGDRWEFVSDFPADYQGLYLRRARFRLP
jgi:hypothetical protein